MSGTAVQKLEQSSDYKGRWNWIFLSISSFTAVRLGNHFVPCFGTEVEVLGGTIRL